MAKYDAIIVGAGHNGLVTAAYLARAGWKVLVLEARSMVGGCCVTEELWPGFKVSTAAYVNSLLRPVVIKELDLARHGFQMIPRSPSSFTPFPDGRTLLMGPDKELTRREIAKFSKKDAENYEGYENMLTRVADCLEPLLDEVPPNPWGGLRDVFQLGKLAWRFRRLGRAVGEETVEMLTGAASTILDRWFESEELKATLATDAVIGAFAAPSTPGTAYVLFHHVMGECNGVRGVWGYVKGGMGQLSASLASAARAAGAEILTESAVASIRLNKDQVIGVVTRDGREFASDKVVSNADAHVTFCQLLAEKDLPREFLQGIRKIDYSSATVKMNVALHEPPRFRALPHEGIGPEHHGTMHLCPSRDYIETAFQEAKKGRPSTSPMIECTLPTALDPTLAPEGKHIMGLFIQYAPYHLTGSTWEEERTAFAEKCLDIVNEYAPNFKNALIDYSIHTPVDMERDWGITGGNIMHGVMESSNMFFLRPTAGYAQYKTPIRGLYLCGAAAHPGGGVMGAAGRNAARVILKDRG